MNGYGDQAADAAPLSGLLSQFYGLFGGGQASPQPGAAPMDIRPAGLQQTMAQQQPQTGGTYNPMSDIGMRLMMAGGRMTPQQRQQIVGSIPGAVAQNYYADQMRQHPAQPDQPVAGLLGNGAPITPEMVQGNNDVWSNMGRGLNADGSQNINGGFPAPAQPSPMQQRARYGMY